MTVTILVDDTYSVGDTVSYNGYDWSVERLIDQGNGVYRAVLRRQR